MSPIDAANARLEILEMIFEEFDVTFDERGGSIVFQDRFVHLVKVDGFQEMEFVVGDGPSHLGSHACWKVRASSDERAIGVVGAHYVASVTVRVTCDRLW